MPAATEQSGQMSLESVCVGWVDETSHRLSRNSFKKEEKKVFFSLCNEIMSESGSRVRRHFTAEVEFMWTEDWRKKMSSSISRNDTESSTFSLQRVNLQFIPDSYSSEQIWSCAAAQAGNPRVWLPEESDATTGTGCETRQKLRFSRNGIWKMACRVSWWWRRGRRK